MMTGWRKPKNTRLGADFAGEVEAAGRNVTQFHPGDAVFGASRNAFAEYVCAREKSMAPKPANMTFEQAAAAPVAALTALQGLRDHGRIQAGHKVLINGAAGGVGTFAVQIAKFFGAEVTGVCSTRNVDMVRSIGADHVIDYTQADFTRSSQRFDLIFDLIANHSLSACRRILSPRGIHVVGGGSVSGVFKAILAAQVMRGKVAFFIASMNRQDLVVLKELMEAKKVTPVIDRRYSLSEVPAALRYLEEGHARGKVVITLEPSHP
jgi:NADPH:quinone reductase-like Zn-dependent oxidoreductase